MAKDNPTFIFLPVPQRMNFTDFSGMKFGDVTIIGYLGRQNNRNYAWAYRCKCGFAGRVFSVHLCKNNVGICCRHIHLSSRKEYVVWSGMKYRCANQRFKDYGGRGIKVCDRWLHSFENFLADMGPKPSPKHSIDRINNDGNYEPSNCRWATKYQQSNNTRVNRFLTFNGVTMSVAEWARKIGITRECLRLRIKAGCRMEIILMPKKFQCSKLENFR